MNRLFKNIRTVPFLSYGFINTNSNIAFTQGFNEKTLTREDFIKYKNMDYFSGQLYYEKRSKLYEEFIKNLEENNLEKAKEIFDNSTIYGLSKKENICHCDAWKIYEDILNIALKNEYDKFVFFYENLIKNYENHIRKESEDDNKLVFYDSAWMSNNEINFDIIKRFSNMFFRNLVLAYSYSKTKNENSYKILKYLIDSGNLDVDQISYAQNTVCNTGDIDMFKFLDENVKINYSVKYGDFYRNAISRGHQEIANILEKKLAYI